VQEFLQDDLGDAGLARSVVVVATSDEPALMRRQAAYLTLAIAERGRYPAINVLKSVSRTMPRAADQAYLPVIIRARQVMATYADMEELIRLGAYRAGSSAEVDQAIRLHRPLEEFLAQGKEEATSLGQGYQRLEQILGRAETEN
jgi:flagellum-specific ATP synthase